MDPPDRRAQADLWLLLISTGPMALQFWINLHRQLAAGHTAALLYVIHSEGSSPGRMGFRMYVTSEGKLEGSIGGGIMEHKLVELCREKLAQGPFQPLLRRQIHQTNIAERKSGMICSGEQTVAFYYMDQSYLSFTESLFSAGGMIRLDTSGPSHEPAGHLNTRYECLIESESSWSYCEDLSVQNRLYIIGGGHVGYAFSAVMSTLDFSIELFDDREGLNTFEAIQYVNRKSVIDYTKISDVIPEGNDVFVVVMTFGYRTDELVVRALMGKKFRYFGVMGSTEKMKVLFAKMILDGYGEDEIRAIHAPIGLQIGSKTPEEIAVSVAAQIIQIKNTQ
jgi:xanthine dehydrogenase accessory factor